MSKDSSSTSGESLSSESSDGSIDASFGPAEPDVFTQTVRKQQETEDSVISLFERHELFVKANDTHMLSLKRDKHIAFLRRGLFSTGGVSAGLYASQPWVAYWCLQGLTLLDETLSHEEISGVLAFLSRCKNVDGAFGGGPGQLSHLATTYASLLSIAIIGTPEAYQLIEREKLYGFLQSMKNEDGSFRMHEGGEVDVRASYIALICATLTNVVTPQLTSNMADFITACQSYEGGIGAIPGAEAHGGYTFCGLAGMVLLDKAKMLNLHALAEWAVQRQMPIEGGFQGRTNKLVDGCYSFWQGGVFPLLDLSLVNPGMYLDNPDGEIVEAWPEEDGSWLMNQRTLERYILIAAQAPNGGLRDKPSAKPDYYHTCYVLSGMALAQHNAPYSLVPYQKADGLQPELQAGNMIKSTHPLYNIPPKCVFDLKQQFAALPLPSH